MVVTIVLISPIVEILNSGVDVGELLEENQKEFVKVSDDAVSNFSNERILNQYKMNIEEGIVQRLEAVRI